MASKADVHVLYQQAVQCAEAEIDLVDQTFVKLRRRRAKRLREDFRGTASAACERVRRRRTNRAVAVGLDPEVLARGRRLDYLRHRTEVALHRQGPRPVIPRTQHSIGRDGEQAAPRTAGARSC